MKESRTWQKFLSAFKENLEKQSKSSVTVRGYLADLKLFEKWYRGTYGRDSDPSNTKDVDLLSYKSHLQTIKRQAPATINRHIAALRSFFAFLYEKGQTKTFLAEHLKPLEPEPKRAPEVLSHKQVLRFLAAPDKNTAGGKRDFAVLQVFLQAGLRLSEVADIRMEDIEIGERRGTLRVQSGKGNKFREVPLNRTARIAIKEYLEVRPSYPDENHLFISQKRSPLKPRSIYDIVKKYLARTRIANPNIAVHSLRDTMATNLYNQHKDIRLVQEILGHKHIQTTTKYTKKTKEEKEQALEESPLNIYR